MGYSLTLMQAVPLGRSCCVCAGRARAGGLSSGLCSDPEKKPGALHRK
jgi:hypothetical protein